MLCTGLKPTTVLVKKPYSPFFKPTVRPATGLCPRPLKPYPYPTPNPIQILRLASALTLKNLTHALHKPNACPAQTLTKALCFAQARRRPPPAAGGFLERPPCPRQLPRRLPCQLPLLLPPTNRLAPPQHLPQPRPGSFFRSPRALIFLRPSQRFTVTQPPWKPTF